MAEVTNGASTTSRSPVRMLTDLKAKQAQGNRVQLTDDRWHVDWQLGLHGSLFGYTPRWWSNAIVGAAWRGPIASLVSYNEQNLADKLAEFYPDIEAVRFMLNGSDPCAAAVKLARAVTGRDKILVYGYHGTASCYAAPPAGMDSDDNRLGTMEAERDAYVSLEWLSCDLVTRIVADKPAAVIVECPPFDKDKGLASRWLRECSIYAHRVNILFILDEVVTGFRYGPQGASGYYGLSGLVDLYCFGKTLGNGYPIAALAGKREVMQWFAESPDGSGRVHWSNTFNGEPVGLAAALATLRQLEMYPPWEYLIRTGELLKREWNALNLPWRLVGHPTRPVLEPAGLTPELNDLRRFLFGRGHIIVDHPWYVCTETSEDSIKSLVTAARMWKDRRGR